MRLRQSTCLVDHTISCEQKQDPAQKEAKLQYLLQFDCSAKLPQNRIRMGYNPMSKGVLKVS